MQFFLQNIVHLPSEEFRLPRARRYLQRSGCICDCDLRVSSIPLLIRAGICDAEVAYAPTIYVVFSIQLLIRSNFSIHLFSVGVSDVLFFDSDAVVFE